MYLHGGDIYRNNVKYDFSVNINPLGMPEACADAGCKGVILSGAYPDCECEKLRCEIEKNRGIKKEDIIFGNGAAELIYAVCYGIKPKKALIPVPSFYEYERAVVTAGGSVRHFKLNEKNNFNIDESFINEITNDTDIVFLCSPNNPVGNLTERKLIEKIAVKCEMTGTYLCIDECFMPFCERQEEFSMVKEYGRFPHMIVIRAFTKIYAMAGLRLGYALTGDSKTRENIKSKMQPWNVSIPAQMAGEAALNEKGYIEKTVKLIKEEREYLINELSKGLASKIYETNANYILFKGREDLKERFLEKGILIRECSNFENLGKGYFRICVKKHNENMEFIRVFREICNGAFGK